MIAPSWLASVLAAVVLAVALFSAARLVAWRGRRDRIEADADGVHVLMGVAMAGMFVPRLATLPVPVWEVIFVAGAAWFGWRTVETRRALAVTGSGRAWPGRALSGQCCRYPLPHLVDCLAMLYMLWAIPAAGLAGAAAAGTAAGGMGGMGGAAGIRLPVIGLILAVCICGYVVWLGDRIQRFAPARAVTAGGPDVGAGVTGPVATRASAPLLAPRAATCCKIAMGVAMGVMLINLL